MEINKLILETQAKQLLTNNPNIIANFEKDRAGVLENNDVNLEVHGNEVTANFK